MVGAFSSSIGHYHHNNQLEYFSNAHNHNRARAFQPGTAIFNCGRTFSTCLPKINTYAYMLVLRKKFHFEISHFDVMLNHKLSANNPSHWKFQREKLTLPMHIILKTFEHMSVAAIVQMLEHTEGWTSEHIWWVSMLQNACKLTIFHRTTI